MKSNLTIKDMRLYLEACYPDWEELKDFPPKRIVAIYNGKKAQFAAKRARELNERNYHQITIDEWLNEQSN